MADDAKTDFNWKNLKMSVHRRKHNTYVIIKIVYYLTQGISMDHFFNAFTKQNY